jgi:antitoxin SocA-like protein
MKIVEAITGTESSKTIDSGMSILPETAPKLTWRVSLPRGQRRLREAIIYVAKKCETAPHLGLVKLNKIIWRADFDSFAQRGQPVTGRQYQRLPQGPAPVEMLPVLNEMQADRLLRIDRRKIVDFVEHRPVALVDPNLTLFSKGDIDFLDHAIAIYWDENEWCRI